MAKPQQSQFQLIPPGTKVQDIVTGIIGTITGVHVRRTLPPQYYVEYVNATGTACADWWDEDRLEVPTTLSRMDVPAHGTPDGGPILTADDPPVNQGAIGEIANPTR